jgi:uncharacterized metal-binding protein
LIGTIAAVATGTTVAITVGMTQGIALGVGTLIGTYLLSPDLDITSAINNRWGIFKIYWLPYKNMVAHRSIYSHSGFFSATLRLLYLFLPLFTLFWLFLPEMFETMLILAGNNGIFLVWWYFGVVFADFLHCVADWVTEKR